MPFCDICGATTSLNDHEFTDSGGAICYACRNWPTTAPRLIYSAYPDNDLLPIKPPQADETIREFNRRITARKVGDTLFQFLCREADDQISPEEYVRRLDRAIVDIESVRATVLDQMAVHPTTKTPEPTADRPATVRTDVIDAD